MLSVQVIAVGFSLSLFLFVLEIVRRGVLKEKYSILWLASFSVLIVLSLWRDLLDILAGWVGIFYPPSFLFLLAFLFLLMIVLHFSIVISRLTEKNKRLAQDLGLLKMKVELLENKDESEHY